MTHIIWAIWPSRAFELLFFVVQKECHSSVLLPLYSNRIIQTTNGRSEIGKYFTELCQKIKETKPSMVIKYGKQAFWVMCKDRSCTPEMNELGQSKFCSRICDPNQTQRADFN